MPSLAVDLDTIRAQWDRVYQVPGCAPNASWSQFRRVALAVLGVSAAQAASRSLKRRQEMRWRKYSSAEWGPHRISCQLDLRRCFLANRLYDAVRWALDVLLAGGGDERKGMRRTGLPGWFPRASEGNHQVAAAVTEFVQGRREFARDELAKCALNDVGRRRPWVRLRRTLLPLKSD